jgi:hypothetical protein
MCVINSAPFSSTSMPHSGSFAVKHTALPDYGLHLFSISRRVSRVKRAHFTAYPDYISGALRVNAVWSAFLALRFNAKPCDNRTLNTLFLPMNRMDYRPCFGV